MIPNGNISLSPMVGGVKFFHITFSTGKRNMESCFEKKGKKKPLYFWGKYEVKFYSHILWCKQLNMIWFLSNLNMKKHF